MSSNEGFNCNLMYNKKSKYHNMAKYDVGKSSENVIIGRVDAKGMCAFLYLFYEMDEYRSIRLPWQAKTRII
jgi:hypothetical protein